MLKSANFSCQFGDLRCLSYVERIKIKGMRGGYLDIFFAPNGWVFSELDAPSYRTNNIDDGVIMTVEID